MIDDKAIMAAASKYNSDKGFHEEMERISFMDGVAWFKQAHCASLPISIPTDSIMTRREQSL